MDAVILWAADRPGASTAVLRCAGRGDYAYADCRTALSPAGWRPSRGDRAIVVMRDDSPRRIASMERVGDAPGPEPEHLF